MILLAVKTFRFSKDAKATIGAKTGKKSARKENPCTNRSYCAMYSEDGFKRFFAK
jgi:hypothetical protein